MNMVNLIGNDLFLPQEFIKFCLMENLRDARE